MFTKRGEFWYKVDCWMLQILANANRYVILDLFPAWFFNMMRYQTSSATEKQWRQLFSTALWNLLFIEIQHFVFTNFSTKPFYFFRFLYVDLVAIRQLEKFEVRFIFWVFGCPNKFQMKSLFKLKNMKVWRIFLNLFFLLDPELVVTPSTFRKWWGIYRPRLKANMLIGFPTEISQQILQFYLKSTNFTKVFSFQDSWFRGICWRR